jgi:hypothetical protein
MNVLIIYIAGTQDFSKEKLLKALCLVTALPRNLDISSVQTHTFRLITVLFSCLNIVPPLAWKLQPPILIEIKLSL